MRGDIIGSPELESFGAQYKEEFQVPFVKGIAQKILPSDKADKYEVTGVVRKHVERRRGKFSFRFVRNLMDTVYYFMMSDEGVFRNAFVVFVYLIIILAIPLVIYISVIWSLLQINYVKSDIYDRVFTLADVFNSSSYDFWLGELELRWLFYIMGALAILFIIIGMIELICFLATEEKDNGKYPVKKTVARSIVSGLFWVMLIFYSGLYVFYFSII